MSSGPDVHIAVTVIGVPLLIVADVIVVVVVFFS